MIINIKLNAPFKKKNLTIKCKICDFQEVESLGVMALAKLLDTHGQED
jgi:hypothetical protein